MPRNSLQRVVDRRLSEADRASARYCDLQLDLLDGRDDSHVARFGGKWDRREKDYVSDADRSRVVRLHPGQLEFAKWFYDVWLEAHLNGWPVGTVPIYTALVAGGRRGGKTSLLSILIVGYACAVPGSTIWIVVPSDVEEHGKELMAYLEAIMPKSWYASLGSPHWEYQLANGSVIRLLSGFTSKKLKQGKASLVFINEAQQVKSSSYNNVSASIADEGGIVIAAANPPDMGDQGDWVADVAAEAASGKRTHAKAFFIDPLSNPHIDHEALEALRESMSEHEFDVQVRGMFLLPRDVVLHAWDRLENQRPRPDIGECTLDFTRHHEGRQYKHIVGIDVQKYPWIVAAVAHAYKNPESASMDDALLWFDDEVFIEEGDEVDCAAELIARGYDPKETLLVVDASGDYQQAERKDKFQRPEFKGKGSWDMLRSLGFRHIVGPDPYMSKNPEIAERVRAANARIGTKSRKRYVFADPERSPRLVTTVREWRVKNGQPDRRGKAAHAGDAMTYVVWRFFPRRQMGGSGTTDTSASSLSSARRFQGKNRTKGF